MSTKSIERSFEQHIQTAKASQEKLQAEVADAGQLIVKTIASGHTVFICGNGGSAADAQHIAAEFTGRFVTERIGLPAIALTTDTSALTAIGNDYGYARIFSRQLEALGKAGDLLLAISTSGNSPNIIEALRTAKTKGMVTLGLSGKDGGQMNDNCDVNIVVPSAVTARIQEMHILIGHIFCELVDEWYGSSSKNNDTAENEKSTLS
ncbi:MAG TPA: D-sedoheptulose 7-phosphate isomerase [Flavisolibacter sp.]|nr:D-sedoheptulose 7-phosphate isomerase [Flavisolibacter sp.]